MLAKDFNFKEDMLTLETAIGTAIGQASMCWDPPPSGTFEREKAQLIAEVLLAEFKLIIAQNAQRIVEVLVSEIEVLADKYEDNKEVE